MGSLREWAKKDEEFRLAVLLWLKGKDGLKAVAKGPNWLCCERNKGRNVTRKGGWKDVVCRQGARKRGSSAIEEDDPISSL